MSERAKPFVAHVTSDAVSAAMRGDVTYYPLHLNSHLQSGPYIPVVVTPLLPDDPRPGETWHGPVTPSGGPDLVVESAPYTNDEYEWCVQTDRGEFEIRDLRRPPALKTFRFVTHNGTWTSVEIVAESREAAAKKLADALEEVS